MGDIFGNIFDDEEKKQGDGIEVQSSQTQTATQPQGDSRIFGDIFADSGTAQDIQRDTQQQNVQPQEEDQGFFSKVGDVAKGIGSKALDAGKAVTKWGLDVFRNQIQRNNQAMLEHANWQNANLGFNGGKQYATYEEYEQDIPLVKFFNSDTGKKVVGTISETTSNIPIKKAAEIKSKYDVAKDVVTGQIPLKDFANLREISDKAYEEAYAAFLTERNDPDNPTWQKFLYELQDTGVQSGIGILLSMGTAALTRNATAGTAVSSAYYTALSADEQIQSKGKVDSLGNIAIDVVGDQVINKVLGGVLSGGSKSTFKAALEGFGVEGSTEVLQSLTKYANDYANATTEEAKQAVLAEAKQYVTSGAIAMEFGVGGVIGGIADVAVNANVNTSAQPNEKTVKPSAPKVPLTPPEITIDNMDIDEAVNELVRLENSGDIQNDPQTQARALQLREAVNDYTRAFNDKTQFVPSEVAEAPLIDITTTQLPSGKYAVKFSANTESNGVSSMYDFNQLFETQQDATKSAQDAIIAWAQSQDAETATERAELKKMIDYAQNPRTLDISTLAADEQFIEQQDIETRGEIDATALEQDLTKVSEAAPELTRAARAAQVGEVIQYTPANATSATQRATGEVIRVNEKSITLRGTDGRTKRIPITSQITENISDQISEEGRQVFDTEKAPRKEPVQRQQEQEQEAAQELPPQVEAVVEKTTSPENIEDQTPEDLNAVFMAIAASNPLESIDSAQYKEMSARGYDLKNNNDPSQGFAMVDDIILNNKRESLKNTKIVIEETLKGNREKLRVDNETMIKRLRSMDGIPDDATPNTKVKIYRGAREEIGTGDLVTINKKAAEAYRESRPASKLYEIETELKNLVQAHGKLHEFVYAPKQLTDDFVAFLEQSKAEAEQYTTPEAITNAEEAIEKVVERFRKTAGLLAGKDAKAGVRQRVVTNAVGDVQFVANDFKLSRAKADMARQAADMKSYARDLLYEEDPIFKDAIDALEKAQSGEETDLDSLNEAVKRLKVANSKNAYAPSGYASAVFSVDQLKDAPQPETEGAEVPIKLAHLDQIRPVEMPELVDIARELMGNVPQVTDLKGGKDGGVKLGDFMPSGGGRIRLQRFLFEQENLPQAAKTLAHEMGHLIDYLPEGNIKRGNLLGRLASLRGFMKTTFSFENGSSLPKTERNRLRTEARRSVAESKNKLQKDFTDADKKEVSKIYKENVKAAIEAGGYIENKTIKKELLTLTRWWKPYDPAVSESYNKYRESAAELYADAISVLFNAPRRLQDLAPTFYEKFFEGLDAKPDVREAYFEVQALLSGDREAVVKRRREGVKRMFKEGDYKAIDLHNRRVSEQENRRKQYWSHFKHTVIDRNYQIIDRVKKAKKQGKSINPDENPEYFLEERNYIGGKIKAIFEREFNTIYSTLNENDITWEDFGEVLFYERIAAGDRSDVANPRGITPKAAQELLENIKTEYGDARWDIMQEQVQKFRDANRKITEDAYEAGLYKKDLYDKMQENPAYVTFQVLDYLEDGMTSRVYKSLGTLKDVTNPADATMLKIITTIRAAERNRTTRSIIDFLKKENPEDIVEAKYAKSKKGRVPMQSKKPNQELVTFFEEGVVKGYYVDPYIAQTINNQSLEASIPFMPFIKFMNKTLFRPLFISLNPGFQIANLKRDFFRKYKNTKGASLLSTVRFYTDKEVLRLSRVRAFGEPKNIEKMKDEVVKQYKEAAEMLNKLEEEKVLSTPFSAISQGATDADKQIEKILANTGVKDFQPKPTIEKLPKFARPAVKALDKTGILKASSEMLGFIENVGTFIETLPKAAGVYEILREKGELTKEDKSFIRRKIGSPDFLAGGTYKPTTNELFLFSNAIIQGIRSDIEVATDPNTRAGWWLKTFKISFLPKLLMMAVLYGALGDEYKEMMEDASEYDKTNYTVIPLGKDSTGKTIYFRLVQDETSRLLGGIFWKFLRAGKNEKSLGSDIMDVVSYTGGQLPSITPALESLGATGQYLSGRNPYDAFRGRQVLSDTTFTAGGTEATKAFLGWQFQQLGGGVFYRFYHEPSAQREEGKVEKFFNAPVIGNILGRFVRVSDYGQVEQLKQIEAKVEKEKAQETLAERKLINKYIDEARENNIRFATRDLENRLVRESFDGRAPATKDEQTEAKQLVKKFRLSLQRGNADPNVTALIDASSNDVKLELLRQLQSDMSDSEFSALRRDLISSKIVSGDVFNELIKSK